MKRKGKWPWKKGRWRAFRNIPIFWVHQRTTHLDPSELAFHITLNLTGTGLLFLLFSGLPVLESPWWRLAVAFVIVRTASWMLNDHFWGGLQVSFPFVWNRGLASFTGYMAGAAKRLQKTEAVTACYVYGSLVRGEFHRKSDLDMLYVRRPGFSNALRATSFAARERVIAFFTRVPLDLYVGDSIQSLQRYRADEPPLVLKDDAGITRTHYKEWVMLDAYLTQMEKAGGERKDRE
jgi:predicted nucleotidyltransferase